MIKYGGATTSKGCFAGRAEQVIDVSVRRSGEEDGTYGTHRTVADGTKGLVESGKAASSEFRSLCLLEFKVRSG